MGSEMCIRDRYGRAPSTRIAVLVFFEGNDLKDLKREQEALDQFHSTKRRPFREVHRNPGHSFLIYVAYALSELRQTVQPDSERSQPLPGSNRVNNATLRIGERDFPVTISYAPDSVKDLTGIEINLLHEAIAGWGETARELGMEPVLAFMPCKHRVFHEHLEFHTDADPSLSRWQPSDFPADIQALCEANSVQFVNLTTNLVTATNNGTIVYNRIWDTHLNKDGAAVVAETLTKTLADGEDPPKQLPVLVEPSRNVHN